MRPLNRREFLGALSASLLTPMPSSLEGPELRNEFFHLRLRADAGVLHLEELSFNQERGRPGSGFVANLLFASPEVPMQRSCTAILAKGLDWQFSRMGQASGTHSGASVQGNSMKVDGILIGPEGSPLARESWVLEVLGDRLAWTIEREFLRDCQVLADRFPAIVFRTFAGNPAFPRSDLHHYSFVEIPGFLDTSMRLAGSAGYPLGVPEREWYECLSDRQQQEIAFAPSGVALSSRIETGLFSVAKVCSDGTAPAISFGAQTVDPRSAPAFRSRGFVQKQTWNLKMLPQPGASQLQLSLSDPFLTGAGKSFAAVHNQWMGWIFGNNPASTPCLHEAGWFSMIQGIYAQSPVHQEAMGKELLFFASQGMEEDGFVLPRWCSKGFFRVRLGTLIDQVPHMILAAFHHACNTGSRDFAAEIMPKLNRIARYMLALDRDGDGVIEVPNTTGLADGKRDCANWYDVIKFGHKDAYTDIYCILALDAMAQMQDWLGDTGSAMRFRELHHKWSAAFNRTFWDDKAGYYMDWIDVREKMPESGRRYFYTDHNLLAIIFGIASPSRAARILQSLDRRYDELYREFKLAPNAIYATPCNMNPVSNMGDMVEFGEHVNQKVFPNYENGCSFFHTTGMEIAARAVAGQPEQAYDLFERTMRLGYARNRFWGAALKWDTGEVISEPLNNALLILWGFLRGCFGVWPSLTGLRKTGPVSRRMEGASYTFCHLGKDVHLAVRDGRVIEL